jgi:hypothetical protein
MNLYAVVSVSATAVHSIVSGSVTESLRDAQSQLLNLQVRSPTATLYVGHFELTARLRPPTTAWDSEPVERPLR